MSALLKTVTLGCKVNQYETELVREGLTRIGYRDTDGDEPADLCLVNTCTVTHEGDAKSRQAIRRLAKDNPDARIIVMGCYATRAPDELERLPGVAEVLTDKREIPDWLMRLGVVDPPTGISGFRGHHRAFLKVQDGCLLRCSYCIIPHVRPHVASREPQHIEDEVLRLIGRGYREFVLTGIHLGHYGVERNRGQSKDEWLRLSHLVRRLVGLPGDFRLRLSSIEATETTRELIAVMAEFPDKVAPHLHVCLQSGSDAVLRRMRRRWSSRMFLDRCELVRRSLDVPALTTDVIVGFPGETDADFEATLRICRQAGFAKIHIFPFSPRKGTPAAGMPDQVPPEIKAERVHRLTDLDAELRQSFLRQLLFRPLKVLMEGITSGVSPRLAGTACRFAPVEIRHVDPQLVGKLVAVSADEVQNGRLVGRLLGNCGT